MNSQGQGAVVSPGEAWLLSTVIKFDSSEASTDRVQVFFADEDGRPHVIPGTISVRLSPDC
jgi:hypothetical protein